MKDLFDKVSKQCSRITTNTYSTSFSLGIYCLHKELRNPIYSIYGFVRFADEIVDSFHDYDKSVLLFRFREETHRAIQEKISLNPILNNFQETVNRYSIDLDLINCFLDSMEMDLSHRDYDTDKFGTYILGSAESVGLMCLYVFCNGNKSQYEELKSYAMNLGSAFQKINFLRDLKQDYIGMGRSYFPNINLTQFDDNSKKQIEKDIAADFEKALVGIKLLPRKARLGVYLSYVYYLALFKKIKNTPSKHMLKFRVRIKNRQKARLLAFSYIKNQFNLL